MEDYLGVQDEVDTLEPVKVNYEELTKEELIKILKDKDEAMEMCNKALEEKDKHFEAQLNSINETYKQNLDRISTVNGYMSRKLKVIKDIITMEEGEK